MNDVVQRLREMRNEIEAKANSLGPLVIAHLLHDAEEEIRSLRVERHVCPDCGGKGGTAPNGVHYCNCDDEEAA